MGYDARYMRVLVVGLLALLHGCGESTVPFASCEETRTHVCEVACACRDGDECRIQIDAALFQHDDMADCLAFWVDVGCRDVDPNEDYGVCNAQLDQAA